MTDGGFIPAWIDMVRNGGPQTCTCGRPATVMCAARTNMGDYASWWCGQAHVPDGWVFGMIARRRSATAPAGGPTPSC
jgi:hypothetical protein